MGKGLSENQKTEIAKATLKTRTLVTIERDNGPLRILANDSVATMDVDSNTYFTRMMKTSGVETSLDGTTDSMVISLSDISQEFAIYVANNDLLTNRKCRVEEAIFDESDNIVGAPVLIFDGVINKIQLTAESLIFTVERILNNYSSLSPNKVYDVNCQFKFKGDKCGYTGTEIKCDKTLTRCEVLGNVLNFGGYPSVVIPTPIK